MIVLEGFQLAILLFLLIRASIADIISGIVENKIIMLAICMGSLYVVPYYVLFANEYLLLYLGNIAITMVLSLTFYATGVWGAGDSKLLIATMLLFPARIYCATGHRIASCFLLLFWVFIVAFLYLFIDTVYMGIKQKNLFQRTYRNFKWKSNLKAILFMYCIMHIFQRIVFVVFPSLYTLDRLLLIAIQFCVSFWGVMVASKVSWRMVAVIMGIVAASFSIYGTLPFHLTNLVSNWTCYIAILALMLFRSISARYNYKSIPITDLKPGMILSTESTLLFSTSRIKGLPAISSEDMRSRLSAEEVESVVCWAKANKWGSTIRVVRKVPFALFIAIGTILYIALEVLLK